MILDYHLSNIRLWFIFIIKICITLKLYHVNQRRSIDYTFISVFIKKYNYIVIIVLYCDLHMARLKWPLAYECVYVQTTTLFCAKYLIQSYPLYAWPDLTWPDLKYTKFDISLFNLPFKSRIEYAYLTCSLKHDGIHLRWNWTLSNNIVGERLSINISLSSV